MYFANNLTFFPHHCSMLEFYLDMKKGSCFHLPASVAQCNGNRTQQEVALGFTNNSIVIGSWSNNHKLTQAVPWETKRKMHISSAWQASWNMILKKHCDLENLIATNRLWNLFISCKYLFIFREVKNWVECCRSELTNYLSATAFQPCTVCDWEHCQVWQSWGSPVYVHNDWNCLYIKPISLEQILLCAQICITKNIIVVC